MFCSCTHRNTNIAVYSTQNGPHSKYWLPEYTTELINVLNVIGLLVEAEPVQASLLERICSGLLIAGEDLRLDGALELPLKTKKAAVHSQMDDLFENQH